ncbi:Peptidoglycan/LPS O-acetylase OafA/YrhL, contains acyltransferase and SGNH-hydrolase domains [Kosakonia radicincitans]|uniref:acyltransferase family protein n=1 Tax=Kosakonia radicincitans TaxID=283686 RepID=UPI0009A73D73|nr:acyltransferase family protein [Kosakonia radicincitans]SKC22461.1 Peptidoglycan/LPS O-acetylase OafA/YrhL, contains acyltransferase and SGNH-hydrolase domains [Kosakonia radicincitans]
MNVRYRADIDGLRALAVLLVFAYHLRLPFFTGGFIGVDVFFVISGFLITGIVVRSIDEGKFSFADFFNRRIKRIVPNVLLVTICTLIAGWFILLPNDYASLIDSSLFTSIYAANFFFWYVTGAYFSSASDEMPLLHMWSLAVEEQFYFVWPLILIVLCKLFKGKHLGIFSVALAVISFAISQHITITDAGYAYYMIHTRSGGLLLGSALALMHRDYKVARNFNSSVAVIIGTAMIFWSAISIDSTSTFPGINSAIPSLGAFLVIAGGSGFRSNIASRIYSIKPVVWVGLISFSIYLWHWPLIAFANYIGCLDSVYVKAIIFIFTMILSFSTLKIIEIPIRRSKLEFLKSLIFFNIIFIIITVAAFVASNITNGFERRFTDKSLYLIKDDIKYAGMDEGWCHVSAEGVKGIKFTNKLANCYIGDKKSQKLALYIGDSHAGHFGPFVDEMAKEAKVKVKQLSTSSCFPTNDIKPFGENPDVCLNFRKLIPKEVESNKYDIIIIANRWERDDANDSYKRTDYNKMMSYYAAHTKKLVIMQQMPEFITNPFTCYERKQCNAETVFKPVPGMVESRLKIEAALSKLPNTVSVDPSYLIKRNGNYSPFAMGSLMYHDTGHMSIRAMKWTYFMYRKDNPNPLM